MGSSALASCLVARLTGYWFYAFTLPRKDLALAGS
jgi:hypothetical protein